MNDALATIQITEEQRLVPQGKKPVSAYMREYESYLALWVTYKGKMMYAGAAPDQRAATQLARDFTEAMLPGVQLTGAAIEV